eukprot:64688-Rhodomonas_salina.5
MMTTASTSAQQPVDGCEEVGAEQDLLVRSVRTLINPQGQSRTSHHRKCFTHRAQLTWMHSDTVSTTWRTMLRQFRPSSSSWIKRGNRTWMHRTASSESWLEKLLPSTGWMARKSRMHCTQPPCSVTIDPLNIPTPRPTRPPASSVEPWSHASAARPWWKHHSTNPSDIGWNHRTCRKRRTQHTSTASDLNTCAQHIDEDCAYLVEDGGAAIRLGHLVLQRCVLALHQQLNHAKREHQERSAPERRASWPKKQKQLSAPGARMPSLRQASYQSRVSPSSPGVRARCRCGKGRRASRSACAF